MSAESDAVHAASLLAVDPASLGGVCLRSLVQPARDQWLELLRELLPREYPLRRVPFNITDGRLLGGLDLAATLRAGRPIADRGVLTATDGGIVVVTMAERLSAHTAACLNAVLDAGEVNVSREGVSLSGAARVAIVALDESMGDEEAVPRSLLDRLAFLVDLSGFDMRTLLPAQYEPREIIEARRRLPQVQVPPDVLDALCATALALDAGSPRVSLLALRAACAAAALEGRTMVTEADAVLAGRLVLAPRANNLPRPESAPRAEQSSADPPDEPAPGDQSPARDGQPPAASQEEAPPPQGEDGPAAEANREPPPITQGDLEDIVLAATQAAIPPGLLLQLRKQQVQRGGGQQSAGRTGALRDAGSRGRPSGVRSGPPTGTARLNVIETLRAAAPWQRLRGRLAGGAARVRIDAADLRVTRHKQRARTLTIFAVDASGSSALNRLAEAKGAVELLLADCYIRRDQVAVVVFRGRTAELLLPPTRSLVRAKRSLAGVPGGGGTPLASAIHAAIAVCSQARRRGETPTLVMLTDGRANVGVGGAGGRERAHQDALRAAATVRTTRTTALFIDTSPRPSDQALEISLAMGARYIPLPFADARALSGVVTAATRNTPSQ